MKKLRFFSMVCLLALVIGSLVGCQREENGTNNGNNGGNSGGGGAQNGYVDLGLPSGTKWKTSNEIGNGSGYYTYDEAISAFGDKLPTKEQFQELRANCTWEWQNNGGFKITGVNGNSIVLHAMGNRDCYGSVSNVDVGGCYWTSTPKDSENAWYFGFGLGGGTVYSNIRCQGYTIRLVQD